MDGLWLNGARVSKETFLYVESLKSCFYLEGIELQKSLNFIMEIDVLMDKRWICLHNVIFPPDAFAMKYS